MAPPRVYTPGEWFGPAAALLPGAARRGEPAATATVTAGPAGAMLLRVCHASLAAFLAAPTDKFPCYFPPQLGKAARLADVPAAAAALRERAAEEASARTAAEDASRQAAELGGEGGGLAAAEQVRSIVASVALTTRGHAGGASRVTCVAVQWSSRFGCCAQVIALVGAHWAPAPPTGERRWWDGGRPAAGRAGTLAAAQAARRYRPEAQLASQWAALELQQSLAAAGPTAVGEIWYVVSAVWWASWVDHLHHWPDATPPGPMANDSLLAPAGVGLRWPLLEGEYELIGGPAWDAVHGVYGGGPALPRRVVAETPLLPGLPPPLVVEVQPLRLRSVSQALFAERLCLAFVFYSAVSWVFADAG